MTTANPLRAQILFTTLVLGALSTACIPDGASQGSVQETAFQDSISEEAEAKIYKVGIAPADIDTPIEKYMDTVNGVNTQCKKLNSLLQSVCCEKYDAGCNVEYICEVVAVDDGDLMSDVAYFYEREKGRPNYAIHHASVLEGVSALLNSLGRYGKSYGALVVAFTRHWIRVDDEETKDLKNKINPNDLSFYFLGAVLTGTTSRRGREMILDYYAAENGILMSVSPTNETSLAQVLSEYRASLFSFKEKEFTGTGSRDLFELNGSGELVPNMSGCIALADMEPPYYRALLRHQHQQN